jgi:lipoprotein Spr
MKGSYLHLIVVLLMSISSCSIFKPTPVAVSSAKPSPFFDNIVVTIGNEEKIKTPVSSTIEKNIGPIEDEVKTSAAMNDFDGIEYIPPAFIRYATILDIEVEKLTNRKLIDYVDQWWGVPYRIGGTSKSGIDCSGFVRGLVAETYGLDLPRSSREQAQFCKRIEKSQVKEGDLVFFSSGRHISHVGMYLRNNKFVHASTSMGVVISDLDEPYWKRKYAYAGRFTQAAE